MLFVITYTIWWYAILFLFGARLFNRRWRGFSRPAFLKSYGTHGIVHSVHDSSSNARINEITGYTLPCGQRMPMMRGKYTCSTPYIEHRWWVWERMRYVRSCYEGYIWSKLYVCAVCSIRDCMVQICVRMVLWYMNVMHVIGVTNRRV